jgi:hypothetical protein
MRLSYTILAILLAAAVASAQTFTTHTIGSSFDRPLGNAWLGGDVHGHSFASTRIGPGYGRAGIDFGVSARLRMLGETLPLGEVSSTATNTLRLGLPQERIGSVRCRAAGYDLPAGTYSSSGSSVPSLNVFWSRADNRTRPSVPVTVGPYTVSLRGAYHASLSASVAYALYEGVPFAGAFGFIEQTATVTTVTVVDAPTGGAFTELAGRVVDQKLVWIFAGANAHSGGFSGSASHSLGAINLWLSAGVRESVLRTFRTLLTSASAPADYRYLFRVGPPL